MPPRKSAAKAKNMAGKTPSEASTMVATQITRRSAGGAASAARVPKRVIPETELTTGGEAKARRVNVQADSIMQCELCKVSSDTPGVIRSSKKI